MQEHWEHYEHGADIGVRGIGATMAAAFEQAALALTAVITDPSGVVANEAVDIVCEAPDPELLLGEWLNALVYEMAVRRMLFGRYQVEIDGTRLRARAFGEPTSVERSRAPPTPACASHPPQTAAGWRRPWSMYREFTKWT